ncbi:DinB family protein [Mobilisporobacter senegalensis]|uniref:DinB family protein n=1 Tax=Mobilisporobacter senegalensis TaxID=1329262 RepID=A0A3N1XUV2_9FIRM|nr:DinB family protein [Mobilisporobacter senegalensis]ROR30404.1 DinB family protein [Mobilisporobacter senegalensis]
MKNSEIKESILFQLDMCWKLYLYHIDNLEDTEVLWAFSPTGLQVHKQEDSWCIDWPETESYEIGPPNIAWTMWHIIYWWSTALDYNFGDGTLRKEDVPWPGSAEKAKATINLLHDKWVSELNNLSDEDYLSNQYAKWPFEGRSFSDIALWLNGELMKNVAEIGYGRFLYATCTK